MEYKDERLLEDAIAKIEQVLVELIKETSASHAVLLLSDVSSIAESASSELARQSGCAQNGARNRINSVRLISHPDIESVYPPET